MISIQPKHVAPGVQIPPVKKGWLGKWRSNFIIAVINALLKGRVVVLNTAGASQSNNSGIYIADKGGLVIQVDLNGLVGSGTGGGITLETNSVENAVQTILNLFSGNGITVSDQGGGKVVFDGAQIKVDGTLAALQTILNLFPGNGITVSDQGAGKIQFDGVSIRVAGTAVNNQKVLNFLAGTNMTITPDANGGVTLTAGGGGGYKGVYNSGLAYAAGSIVYVQTGSTAGTWATATDVAVGVAPGSGSWVQLAFGPLTVIDCSASGQGSMQVNGVSIS
jgi:hypothetical protein